MSLKEKLQIIVITYNREKHVQHTLETLLAPNAPTKDLNILVLDNNSTDGTADVVKSFQVTHPHVSYRKNHYNLGIGGNIARAMEIANQEYVWILGDDDLYDFTYWHEVVEAIERGEKMICVAKYALPAEHENEIPYQLFQLTFITGGIYHTSLFTNETIRNVYDSIYTLFPHLPPLIAFLNQGNSVYVCSHAIAYNGWKVTQTDSSYTRGTKDVSMLTVRTQQMTWLLGYANVLTLLNQKQLIVSCMEVAIYYPDIFPNLRIFDKYMLHLLRFEQNHFLEVWSVIPRSLKKRFYVYSCKRIIRRMFKFFKK